jgi:hypothetical protein
MRLIARSTDLDVSNPNHKVYSLLGLLPTKEVRLIRVDYSLPPCEVLLDAVLASKQTE